MNLDDRNPERNFYYFNHESENCGTTFVVSVTNFNSMLSEDIPEDLRFGTETCGGKCLHIADLTICEQDCRWAPYRRFLTQLYHRKREMRCVMVEDAG
jgi:hypothetical protein